MSIIAPTTKNLLLRQLLLMSYAKAINKQYKRHGSLWQKRFRRIEQHDVAWQQKRLCYIHHNPIHHRYESEYDTWRYSSYKSYLSDKASNLVRQPVWDWFAADQAQAKLGFIALHEEYKQDFLWDDYEEE
jgi:putative transposase